MSKRDLKKYLSSLDKEQVSEQLLELYDKFREVKTYYDFVFNPREDKLVEEAKLKIRNEYFPTKSKRAKLRRSVAQKYIKQYLTLGVEPHALADLMFFTIEIAMKYSAKREMKYSSFYKSILTAYSQAVRYTVAHGIVQDFRDRVILIESEARRQRWDNQFSFTEISDSVNV